MALVPQIADNEKDKPARSHRAFYFSFSKPASDLPTDLLVQRAFRGRLECGSMERLKRVSWPRICEKGVW
jgi:hypothetical protein